MEKKIATVSIMVTDKNAVEKVNELLHGFGDYIIGRLGVPYKDKNINIICVVLDAEQTVINSLSGKLGMLEGVSSKVLLSK